MVTRKGHPRGYWCPVCGDRLSTSAGREAARGWLRRLHQHTPVEWAAAAVVLMEARQAELEGFLGA